MGWIDSSGYWLARLLLERGIAALFAVAFVAAYNQFPALLGERGLLPVPRLLAVTTFRDSPSLFHLHYSDRLLRALTLAGAAASVAIVAGAVDLLPVWAGILLWLTIWFLYLSIVNVGQTFYAFGWESILLEAGFLAAFLGPSSVATPLPVIYLVRWLLFRIEFGAGLIKMRGDPCWRDLTCLYYHHETQPMPGPLSWHFHRLPRPVHRAEVLANHFAQLVVPFGLFVPQPGAGIAGAVVVVTQLWLVASGNFSWLNWVTIVLALSCIGDGFAGIPDHAAAPAPLWFDAVVLAVLAVQAALSYWPVRNMLSRRQLMNFSFNRLHLVGTYGAFGSITRRRREVVIEGAHEPGPGKEPQWREYGFKGKPGDPARRPPQVAPYHLRLDWLMWFVPLSPAYAGAWFRRLLQRLLEGDRATLRLLADNPFPDRPPDLLRAQMYRYRFTTRAERRATGRWWERELEGTFVGPVTLTR